MIQKEEVLGKEHLKEGLAEINSDFYRIANQLKSNPESIDLETFKVFVLKSCNKLQKAVNLEP